MGDVAPSEGIYGLDTQPEDAGVVLIGVPWEATTSYGRGTARGPEAILAASVQVDLFDVALAARGVPEPAAAGIALLPTDDVIHDLAADASHHAQRVIDRYAAGKPVASDDPDLLIVNQLSNKVHAWVESTARAWRLRGKLVGLVGGDHSSAFGAIAAAAAEHPGLGVLQVDAHADLRVDYQGFTHSHASIMHNVRSRLPSVGKIVSVGVRDLCAEEHAAIGASEGGVKAFFDAENADRAMSGTDWRTICDEVADALPEEVYVSFDIDGLEPALCPSTGTPVPGGLSYHQAQGLLAALLRANKRIVGFDLCEVAPGPTEWDANVGARVLYQLIGHMLASRLND
jgi:agmatinase